MASIRWLLLPLLLCLTAGLCYTVLSLPDQPEGLQTMVVDNIDKSGVSNPVTAVLLNYRGYDTLLEMIVLLLAMLGVWSLRVPHLVRKIRPVPVLDNLTRFLVPVLILVAGYLLWVGAHAPGGAFQAGSVVGAAGVMLLLSGWHIPPSLAAIVLKLSLVAGSVTFLAVAVFTLLSEGQLLEYPQEYAGFLILVIETAATVSIGVTLAALFLEADLQTVRNLNEWSVALCIGRCGAFQPWVARTDYSLAPVAQDPGAQRDGQWGLHGAGRTGKRYRGCSGRCCAPCHGHNRYSGGCVGNRPGTLFNVEADRGNRPC